MHKRYSKQMKHNAKEKELILVFLCILLLKMQFIDIIVYLRCYGHIKKKESCYS